MKSLREKAQDWDGDYVFPRPANEQFLSPYKAFLRISAAIGRGIIATIVTVISFSVLLYTYHTVINELSWNYFQGNGAMLTIITVCAAILLFILCTLDITSIILPFREEYQLESYGGQVWANARHLMDKGLLKLADEKLGRSGIYLAPFKKSIFSLAKVKYRIFLDLVRLSEATVIFGPPGSGKSSTFFIPLIRQFAKCGGVVALDVKGELYRYSAHQFANVYRLDIENPFNSDWFDLFGGCRRNPDEARKIASFIVGNDANKSSGTDPFWNDSAVAMLQIIILFLCEKLEHPTPRDILEFLANHPKSAIFGYDQRGNPVYVHPLDKAFERCEYQIVRDLWLNNYGDLNERTYSSIKSKIDTILAELLSPKIDEVLRPPTERERELGRRRINFNDLREYFTYQTESMIDPLKAAKGKLKRGTGIFLVITPEEALTMKVFLRVFFSMAISELRKSGAEDSGNVLPVMVAIDEAGNVPLANLPEGINTDRSKQICYVLGYQELNQPMSQYGKESANAYLASVATTVFLPGVEDDTAALASKRIGETTILQRQSSDAKNDGLDSERFTEVGRKLILPQDLTTLKKFTQMVVLIKGANPIRTKVPEDSKKTDTRLAHPARLVYKVDEQALKAMGLLRDQEGKVVAAPNIGKRLSKAAIADLIRNNVIESDPAADNSAEYSHWRELFTDEDAQIREHLKETDEENMQRLEDKYQQNESHAKKEQTLSDEDEKRRRQLKESAANPVNEPDDFLVGTDGDDIPQSVDNHVDQLFGG